MAAEIAGHARRLFQSRHYLCGEAVLIALNRGLGGNLDENQAVALAAPFGNALGDSGCLCGALSGAVMACGLLIGGEHAYRRRGRMRKCARQLHDTFKAAHGATCCRILSRKVSRDRNAHFKQCQELTAFSAGTATNLVLGLRPELALGPVHGLRSKKSSEWGRILEKLTILFGKHLRVWR